MNWPPPQTLETERFFLEPLTVEHAHPMVKVLADRGLYEFTGDEPPTYRELLRRYTAQCAGQSKDGSQWWLNWVIRSKSTGGLAGFVQATVEGEDLNLSADIAWVVATEFQGKGVATEAAREMMNWLREHNIYSFLAFVHPEHQASMAVAKKLGLSPTTTVEDGEVRWELTPMTR